MNSGPTPGTLRRVIGTLVNVAGVCLGGFAGILTGRNLPPATQQQTRQILTAATVLTAAWVFWKGLEPSLVPALKQILLAVLALSVGSLIGHGLGLQRRVTQLLRWAAGDGNRVADATQVFAVQAIVFAMNPLGWIGATLEGVSGVWQPLALKAGLDGLAALGFAAAGSRHVVLAAVPMAAVQGTLTLMGVAIRAQFLQPAQIAILQVEAGFLILITAPVIFGWRQVPLANYLPALVLAPLFSLAWR